MNEIRENIEIILMLQASQIITRGEARRLVKDVSPSFFKDISLAESPPATDAEAEALPAVEVTGGEDEIEKARRQVG